MPHLRTKTLMSGALATVAALSLSHAAYAADAKSETERVEKSITVLNELVKTPDDAVPEHILKRAEAIVVIPTLVKGGFIVGAEHGKGVMSVRDQATGAWSVPAFVQLTGGSIGWQIGVQSTDLVLLVMNKDGVDDLLKSEFKLGANASVAAGPVGRSAQANTDATMNAKILAYSRAKGLFAGVSVEGASLRDDESANGDFYGKEQSSKAVFATKPSSVPAIVSTWRTTLQRVAAR